MLLKCIEDIYVCDHHVRKSRSQVRKTSDTRDINWNDHKYIVKTGIKETIIAISNLWTWEPLNNAHTRSSSFPKKGKEAKGEDKPTGSKEAASNAIV